ncbi:MAG: hypothetical protein P8J14_11145 [Emcibacteraceae bacterium]|nr:hypothetical protein [Emcibacteraceae bacterium]
MPFLSIRDSRELSQGLTEASFVEEASFGETFAAGVGQVFDEELSISSMLNMQGFNQRKAQVKELGNSGAFNIGEYTSAVGDVDYSRIQTDFPQFNLKSDQTLFDERAELLKGRREYAQDVFDRGNGMAQFLGMATAYMLDPINIATMPIATAGTTVKGLGTLGRAIQIGKNEAGLAIAAELMIQPLVYQHKHDINSPFEFSDALLNIATASAGAFAIGSATGGISGYLKAVREKTVDLPLDEDASMALSGLARVEDDLNIIKASSKPKEVVYHGTNADFEKFSSEFINKNEPKGDYVGEGIFFTTSKETAGKYGKNIMKAELSLDNPLIIKTEADARALRDSFGGDVEYFTLMKKSPNAIKKELQSRGYDGLVDDLYGQRAVFSESQIKTLSDADINAREVKADAEILTELNSKMEVNNQPSKVKENYVQPKKQAATTGSVTQRERAVVERNGLTQDYDADIEAFNTLENPRIVQDDEVVNATDFMKSIDDEINGIDEVLRCAIG